MRVYDIGNDFNDVSSDWKPGSNYYWIISDAKDICQVNEKIILDRDSIEECTNLKQSAKITFFDSYIFIVFNVLEFKNEDIISKELNIYLGKDYIITIYKDDAEIIESLVSDIGNKRDSFILKEIPKPCIVLYYILDRIIVRNYNIISDLEAQADKIELSILKRPSEKQVKQLINLRRQVYKVRKFLNPLRYIGDSIVINDNNIIEKENIRYFESLNIKIGKLMQAQENLVQDLALVREAFESEIANKTNSLMKVFTIVAAIFLPLNLITGLFSMCFTTMPFKDAPYGFYAVLFLMTALVLCLTIIFKKNRWL